MEKELDHSCVNKQENELELLQRVEIYKTKETWGAIKVERDAAEENLNEKGYAKHQLVIGNF